MTDDNKLPMFDAAHGVFNQTPNSLVVIGTSGNEKLVQPPFRHIEQARNKPC